MVSEPVIIPTNTAASSSKKKLPSLKDIQSGNFTIQKEEKVEHVRTEREAFTESDFNECWENCIAELKKKNQSSLNVMLASIQVTEVSKEQYKAVFPNKIQHDLYLQEKAYIMQFMREGLKNFSLEIVEEVTPQANDYKPYTGAEKFKALAEKNPTLIELQEKLGLDLA